MEMFEFISDHEDVCIYRGVVTEAGFSIGSQFPIVGEEDIYVIILAGEYRFKIPLRKGEIIKD